MTLAFGTIDPGATSNYTATATRNFVCNGSAPNATFLITAGDGLYASTPGVRRMRHGTTLTEYMTYGLSLSPAAATVPKGVTQTLTVTGTLTPTDFGNVLAGGYSDTVAITLNP
jgi:spore coat protein U-like protein